MKKSFNDYNSVEKRMLALHFWDMKIMDYSPLSPEDLDEITEYIPITEEDSLEDYWSNLHYIAKNKDEFNKVAKIVKKLYKKYNLSDLKF